MRTIQEKEQHNKKEKARYQQVMAAAIAQLGGECSKCKSTVDLQIDHIDPQTKSFEISSAWSSPSKFQSELIKCQLLCETCHKLKTNDDFKQGMKYRIHGTWAMYSRGKCRCDPCKKVYNDYRREWRRKRRQD